MRAIPGLTATHEAKRRRKEKVQPGANGREGDGRLEGTRTTDSEANTVEVQEKAIEDTFNSTSFSSIVRSYVPGIAHGGGRRSGDRGCRSSGRRGGEQWRADDSYTSHGSSELSRALVKELASCRGAREHAKSRRKSYPHLRKKGLVVAKSLPKKSGSIRKNSPRISRVSWKVISTFRGATSVAKKRVSWCSVSGLDSARLAVS